MSIVVREVSRSVFVFIRQYFYSTFNMQVGKLDVMKFLFTQAF